jgi:isoquinoline 1-oxidoreductase beta subunit
MSPVSIENVSRRNFLQGVAGLTLSFCLPALATSAATAAAGKAAARAAAPAG